MNITNSTLTPPLIPQLTPLEAALFGVVFLSLTVLGVSGNLLVIVAISTDAKMRKSAMNKLLLNLAVADLCNLVFCVQEWVQPVYKRTPAWLIPGALCPLLRYMEVVFLFASLLTQVAVCVERFIVIVFPMRVQLMHGRHRIPIVALCIWAFSLLFALPYAIYHRLGSGHCSMLWHIFAPSVYMAYKYAECLIFYFLPLVIIIVLYAKVSCILWSKNQQLHEGSRSHEPNETLKVRKNVVKMLIGCVGVYFICYSPIQVLFLSMAMFGHRISLQYQVSLTLNALAFACSACNPLMYTLFSQKFRAKFADLICCRKPDPARTVVSCATTGHYGRITTTNRTQEEMSLLRAPLSASVRFSETETQALIEQKYRLRIMSSPQRVPSNDIN